MLDFSNYSLKLKYYDDSSKLMVGNMTNETASVAIEKFVGLKPKIYSFLVDDSSKRKKMKGVNKNVVATISYNEYKDALLNNKFLRHLSGLIHHHCSILNKLIDIVFPIYFAIS